MRKEKLISLMAQRKSFLCVGLDPDLDKVPQVFLEEEDPIFSFNKAVIDATRDICVAYKPNLAFYECFGSKGWISLEKTLEYIGKEHFIIADAKRGDIGNTSTYYAKAFFDTLGCDAVTIAPYMGQDSVQPFLKGYSDKWAVVLALTSNVGAKDFQKVKDTEGKFLFERVITHTMSWGSEDSVMFVVGATQLESISHIRNLAPRHFFLIPGVGEQGGNLHEVFQAGKNAEIGMLVNSSRSILYAHQKFPGLPYAEAVRKEAKEIQSIMLELLKNSGFVE
jgi:orotidine-5'-phosphate decarboxylase